MSELHLNGMLDLSGDLTLGGKVFAGNAQILVALDPSPESQHAIGGPLLTPPPLPTKDPTFVWVTGSANTNVKIGAKAAVVASASVCMQGDAAGRPGCVFPKVGQITIDGNPVVVVGDKAQIFTAANPTPLTSSGQKK